MGESGSCLDFIDVVRAYFHAKATRKVYVELPREDQQEGMCRLLNKAMYGTRDAAQNWEMEYTSMMVENGFKQGSYSACVFYNKERDIRVVIHGDDFTVLGKEKELDWLRERIQRRMEVKCKQRLRRGEQGAVRILNRIVSSTDEGLEYEADQRHAEIIMKELGLTKESKGLSTPGVQEGKEEVRDEQGGEVDEKMYRAMAARANYSAQDRVDIQFAAKEVSRFMSKPEISDWRKVKRLGRYLRDSGRVVYKFGFQRMPEEIVVWSDTDFAGCKKTRRSTSGGVVMFGSHCVKTYSSTQDIVALSSGEAEFYGIVKAGSYGLGMVGLGRDLGLNLRLRINTDSSAARSIGSRKGAGKVRHLDVRELWIQERIARGDLTVRKVSGIENLADILTKHVPRAVLDKHMEKMGAVRAEGRHPLSPGI
jgi:hypothetical protein